MKDYKVNQPKDHLSHSLNNYMEKHKNDEMGKRNKSKSKALSKLKK